jgi:hypothetical protein
MSDCVMSLTWMLLGEAVDSMRLAVLTVSPNRQKRGMRVPTTPLTTGPEWMPTRRRTGRPVSGMLI